MSRELELEIGERVLGNGLTLLAVRNPGVETYAAGALLDVDIKDEASSEEGLANLVGDMLDEGSKKRDGIKLALAIESLGGVLEGSPSGGSVQCPFEQADKSLALLFEIVHEPAFPQRELTRVKDEILTELRSEEDDPRSVAALRFRKLVYGPHPYARPSKGTRKSLARFKRADLVRFHSSWFVPSGGYVAAAGPEPVEHMLDQLERAFRRLRGPKVEHVDPAEATLPDGPHDEHFPMEREQVHVFMGHIGIRRMHPDFYALVVMDHILGTGPGFTSRISRRLRDEQGLCYSVNAQITGSAGEEPGMFAAYIGTSQEHRAKAIAGFMHEIELIRSDPPSATELRDVQDYLTGSFVFGLERNTNLARYAVRSKRFDLGPDYLQRYPGLIRSVTAEDVLRVARAHLHPDKMIVVSAGAGKR